VRTGGACSGGAGGGSADGCSVRGGDAGGDRELSTEEPGSSQLGMGRCCGSWSRNPAWHERCDTSGDCNDQCGSLIHISLSMSSSPSMRPANRDVACTRSHVETRYKHDDAGWQGSFSHESLIRRGAREKI